MSSGYPAYLGLLESGELARRVQLALESLADCALCGRVCHADRLHGGESKSFCRSGRYASVSSVFPHHGEEKNYHVQVCFLRIPRGWNLRRPSCLIIIADKVGVIEANSRKLFDFLLRILLVHHTFLMPSYPFGFNVCFLK